MSFDYDQYIREGTIPHIMCPGCGNGIAMKSIIRAVDSAGIKKDDMVVVSGIGCSSRIPGYLDFNTLHGTHGRAIPFATGIKLAKPKVMVITGDGDALAIGGNHFIHACRRNIDITVVLFNNNTYGMTGGQVSPTTPLKAWQTTTPYGNIDHPFDICALAIAAGATFVARGTSYHTVPLERLITKALQHKGFALVEAIVGCGKRLKVEAPVFRHSQHQIVIGRQAAGLVAVAGPCHRFTSEEDGLHHDTEVEEQIGQLDLAGCEVAESVATPVNQIGFGMNGAGLGMLAQRLGQSCQCPRPQAVIAGHPGDELGLRRPPTPIDSRHLAQARHHLYAERKLPHDFDGAVG